MQASTVARLGFLAVVSVLTGCASKCEVVPYAADGTVGDTISIEKTGGDCTVVTYAADSVAPKPK